MRPFAIVKEVLEVILSVKRYEPLACFFSVFFVCAEILIAFGSVDESKLVKPVDDEPDTVKFVIGTCVVFDVVNLAHLRDFGSIVVIAEIAE